MVRCVFCAGDHLGRSFSGESGRCELEDCFQTVVTHGGSLVAPILSSVASLAVSCQCTELNTCCHSENISAVLLYRQCELSSTPCKTESSESMDSCTCIVAPSPPVRNSATRQIQLSSGRKYNRHLQPCRGP